MKINERDVPFPVSDHYVEIAALAAQSFSPSQESSGKRSVEVKLDAGEIKAINGTDLRFNCQIAGMGVYTTSLLLGTELEELLKVPITTGGGMVGRHDSELHAVMWLSEAERLPPNPNKAT